MEAIRPLWGEMPLRLPDRTAEAGRTPAFGRIFEEAVTASRGLDIRPVTDLFTSAIDAVKETDAQKVQMEYLMATGQLDNPALLTTALTKAQISVNLLVELRNKAMDAYNELMRISL